jgi:hypothetical protein
MVSGAILSKAEVVPGKAGLAPAKGGSIPFESGAAQTEAANSLGPRHDPIGRGRGSMRRRDDVTGLGCDPNAGNAIRSPGGEKPPAKAATPIDRGCDPIDRGCDPLSRGRDGDR